VVVGADRIAANGDTAIGNLQSSTGCQGSQYSLLCRCTPSRLILSYPPAANSIEERDPAEIYQVGDTIIAPPEVEFYNPAFDVTPAELIAAIITEHGAFAPVSYNSCRHSQSLMADLTLYRG